MITSDYFEAARLDPDDESCREWAIEPTELGQISMHLDREECNYGVDDYWADCLEDAPFETRAFRGFLVCRDKAHALEVMRKLDSDYVETAEELAGQETDAAGWNRDYERTLI